MGANRNEDTYISFVDVGQGDCSIISFDNKNYMIDSGGSLFQKNDVGEKILYPYLLKNGIKEMDAIIISHFDADHAKGVISILDKIAVKEIIIGYEKADNEIYNEIIKKARENNIKITVIENPIKRKIDSENEFILLPSTKENLNYYSENNNSLLVIFRSGENKVLFTGDIEKEREEDLLKNKYIKDIDIIKVPHHGSKTSSTYEFLKKVNPETGIIQVGKNGYGHPNEEVINRYTELGIPIYRNDLSGMIQLKLGEEDYTIEKHIKEKKSFKEEIVRFTDETNIIILIIEVIMCAIFVENHKRKVKVIDIYELQRVFEKHKRK